MKHHSNNISIDQGSPSFRNNLQLIAGIIGLLGLLILISSIFIDFPYQSLILSISLVFMIGGILWFSWEQYKHIPMGIKNNGVWFNAISNRGIWAIVLGIIFTGFYILLYWFPVYLGLGQDSLPNSKLIALFDPLSQFLKHQPASQWFVYGVLYTLAIIGFGFKFILKYRHNKYQQLRTISVMFFQLGFAFLLPEIMMRLNQPYYNFANMWPLNYYFFDEWHIKGMLNAQNIGYFMLIFGLFMIFIISPILTYKYGKRWYCSWVCGCGGLAETVGDTFRQLSTKKLYAWKLERWTIHLILVFSFLMTIAVISSFLSNNAELSIISRNQFLYGVIALMLLIGVVIFYFRRDQLNKDALYALFSVLVIIMVLSLMMSFTGSNSIIGMAPHQLRAWYGFAIGSAFSGVIGVGFYPIFGNRVWCRFGCPMAGILGIQQKLFSRFRITTNGSQCISCGNCSTYCEMGIDVRSYAQKGQNIVRASCVGCGVCSAVCPRGVLRLENGSLDIPERTK